MSIKYMLEVFNMKVGSPTKKLILLKLADNASDQGECFPSYDYIARQCEISRRAVIININNLIKDGLLSKECRKNGDKNSSNIYKLTLSSGERGSLGSDPSSLGGSERGAPITCQSIEPVNEPKDLPPEKLGNESEKNSDLNPTYHTTNINQSLSYRELPPEINVQAFDEWVAFRKSSRKKLSLPSIEKLITKFSKYTKQEQQDTVNHSIENGYTGLFFDKFKGNNYATRNQEITDRNMQLLKQGIEERSSSNTFHENGSNMRIGMDCSYEH